MGRLPFDPGRVTGARAPEPAPAPKHLTVTQLSGLIESTLREIPSGLKVVGEIGQFRERTHWYFDIKDAGAVMSCVMWQSAARKAGFTPAAGQQVLLTGRVEFYPPQGRTQFIVEKIEPVGAGALDLAFKKLCEELRTLGYFSEERKRPLPLLPRKVAIVTSRSAAALQDVLDTVRRRCPSLPLALVDVRVQGEGAAAQVARAITRIGRMHTKLGSGGVDVILVTRGGGSMEDLWAFNERIVAEAIFRSPIPVVAAIGHETDTTIAELVADVRGATPTQAAMRIAPDSGDLRRQLSSMGGRLAGLLARQVRLDAERLRSAARHRAFADPMLIVDEKREELRTRSRDLVHALRERVQRGSAALDHAARRLNRHRPEAVYARRESALTHAAANLRAALAARLTRRADALDAAARALDLVGPHNVLKRGYSVTLRADGTVIRSATEAHTGETIQTRLADGAFTSVVNQQSPGGHAGLSPRSPAKRPNSPKTTDGDQPGLF